PVLADLPRGGRGGGVWLWQCYDGIVALQNNKLCSISREEREEEEEEEEEEANLDGGRASWASRLLGDGIGWLLAAFMSADAIMETTTDLNIPFHPPGGSRTDGKEEEKEKRIKGLAISGFMGLAICIWIPAYLFMRYHSKEEFASDFPAVALSLVACPEIPAAGFCIRQRKGGGDGSEDVQEAS
ncbi:hypothetical protein L249_5310, partial [Ophiocordyceps polyrhachis-furcata BCC 54312]